MTQPHTIPLPAPFDESARSYFSLVAPDPAGFVPNPRVSANAGPQPPAVGSWTGLGCRVPSTFVVQSPFSQLPIETVFGLLPRLPEAVSRTVSDIAAPNVVYSCAVGQVEVLAEAARSSGVGTLWPAEEGASSVSFSQFEDASGPTDAMDTTFSTTMKSQSNRVAALAHPIPLSMARSYLGMQAMCHFVSASCIDEGDEKLPVATDNETEVFSLFLRAALAPFDLDEVLEMVREELRARCEDVDKRPHAVLVPIASILRRVTIRRSNRGLGPCSTFVEVHEPDTTTHLELRQNPKDTPSVKPLASAPPASSTAAVAMRSRGGDTFDLFHLDLPNVVAITHFIIDAFAMLVKRQCLTALWHLQDPTRTAVGLGEDWALPRLREYDPLTVLEHEVRLLKEAGNEAFHKQQFNVAVERYNAAIELASPVTGLRAVLFTNRAMATLRMVAVNDNSVSIGELALLDCTIAVQYDPRYVKAYYRRAQAALELVNNVSERMTLERGVSRKSMLMNAAVDLAVVVTLGDDPQVREANELVSQVLLTNFREGHPVWQEQASLSQTTLTTALQLGCGLDSDPTVSSLQEFDSGVPLCFPNLLREARIPGRHVAVTSFLGLMAHRFNKSTGRGTYVVRPATFDRASHLRQGLPVGQTLSTEVTAHVLAAEDAARDRVSAGGGGTAAAFTGGKGWNGRSSASTAGGSGSVGGGYGGGTGLSEEEEAERERAALLAELEGTTSGGGGGKGGGPSKKDAAKRKEEEKRRKEEAKRKAQLEEEARKKKEKEEAKLKKAKQDQERRERLQQEAMAEAAKAIAAAQAAEAEAAAKAAREQNAAKEASKSKPKKPAASPAALVAPSSSATSHPSPEPPMEEEQEELELAAELEAKARQLREFAEAKRRAKQTGSPEPINNTGAHAAAAAAAAKTPVDEKAADSTTTMDDGADDGSQLSRREKRQLKQQQRQQQLQQQQQQQPQPSATPPAAASGAVPPAGSSSGGVKATAPQKPTTDPAAAATAPTTVPGKKAAPAPAAATTKGVQTPPVPAAGPKTRGILPAPRSSTAAKGVGPSSKALPVPAATPPAPPAPSGSGKKVSAWFRDSPATNPASDVSTTATSSKGTKTTATGVPSPGAPATTTSLKHSSSVESPPSSAPSPGAGAAVPRPRSLRESATDDVVPGPTAPRAPAPPMAGTQASAAAATTLAGASAPPPSFMPAQGTPKHGPAAGSPSSMPTDHGGLGAFTVSSSPPPDPSRIGSTASYVSPPSVQPSVSAARRLPNPDAQPWTGPTTRATPPVRELGGSLAVRSSGGGDRTTGLFPPYVGSGPGAVGDAWGTSWGSARGGEVAASTGTQAVAPSTPLGGAEASPLLNLSRPSASAGGIPDQNSSGVPPGAEAYSNVFTFVTELQPQTAQHSATPSAPHSAEASSSSAAMDTDLAKIFAGTGLL